MITLFVEFVAEYWRPMLSGIAGAILAGLMSRYFSHKIPKPRCEIQFKQNYGTYKAAARIGDYAGGAIFCAVAFYYLLGHVARNNPLWFSFAVAVLAFAHLAAGALCRVVLRDFSFRDFVTAYMVINKIPFFLYVFLLSFGTFWAVVGVCLLLMGATRL